MLCFQSHTRLFFLTSSSKRKGRWDIPFVLIQSSLHPTCVLVAPESVLVSSPTCSGCYNNSAVWFPTPYFLSAPCSHVPALPMSKGSVFIPRPQGFQDPTFPEHCKSRSHNLFPRDWISKIPQYIPISPGPIFSMVYILHTLKAKYPKFRVLYFQHPIIPDPHGFSTL